LTKHLKIKYKKEQGSEENIWTKATGSKRGMEEINIMRRMRGAGHVPCILDVRNAYILRGTYHL
jgi:hypothetical protein